jgi:hypothetical protein
VIFHISIPARNPDLVAGTVARLVGGQHFPFHPVEGARIVLFGDAHGSAIEIYPDNIELDIGTDMLEPRPSPAPPQRFSMHAAIATPLSQAEVFAISGQVGWIARECDRGPFTLLEVWVENRLLLELLTPSSQQDYRRSMTAENWRRWS